MNIGELKTALTTARDMAQTLGEEKPHSGSGLLPAIKGKLNGALDVLENHVRWLESVPAPAVPAAQKAGDSTRPENN